MSPSGTHRTSSYLIYAAFFVLAQIGWCQLPGSRGQYYEEDISGNLTRSDILLKIRAESQLRERRCRIDFCPETKGDDPQKGAFVWPETTIGHRIYVRCPYSFLGTAYAYRDCVLDTTRMNGTAYAKPNYMKWTAIWSDAVISSCPDPPMEETLKKLKRKLDQRSTWTDYLWALRDISSIIRNYAELPVTYRDIIDMVLILYKAVIEGVQQGNVLPRRIIEDAFGICDFVLDHDKKYASVRPLETIRLWLLETMGLLTEMFFPLNEERESNLAGRYITILSMIVNSSSGQLSFSLPTDHSNNTIPLQVTVSVLQPGNHVVHIMYLGHPAIADNQVDVIRYDRQVSAVDGLQTSTLPATIWLWSASDNTTDFKTATVERPTTASSRRRRETKKSSSETVTASYEGTTTENDSHVTSEDNESKLKSVVTGASSGYGEIHVQTTQTSIDGENSLPFNHVTDGNVHEIEINASVSASTPPGDRTKTSRSADSALVSSYGPVTRNPEAGLISLQIDGQTGEVTTTQASSNVGRRRREVAIWKKYMTLGRSLDLLSSIVYVSVSDKYYTGLFAPSWQKPPVDAQIIISAKSGSLDLAKGTENGTRCTNINLQDELSRTGFSMDTWYVNPAHCSDPQITEDEITCTCTSLGFFAMMGTKATSLSTSNDVSPSTLAPTEPSREKVTNNQVFQYRYEVYVAGHVLRVACLVFLLLTIFTYGSIRKASRGTSTHILIHLCVSLLMLLVVLYLAEAVGDTILGCRVINALRYYCVLVSLMWNAIEAVHTYATVIDVIFSHFAMKMTCIGWGVPLIGVAIVLGLDLTGFDGGYDSLCIFRCTLKDHVAYYAFITPMAFITAVSLVMYIVIIRRLLHLEDNECQGKGWYGWARLVASLMMTILLAVPWFFSALSFIDYGYIDIELPAEQGVYQIVFMVFVVLQGLFIFTFYCGGNSYIRARWRAVFVPHSSVSAGEPTKQNETNKQAEQTYTVKEA